MKTKLCVGIVLLAAAMLPAQTNNLTALLQQGLFEEQANRNLDAAIANYQTLALQFDKDRQIAATAIFRLGECYRAQGHTNEAAVQYQRILRDFSDQQTLATLSRQDLAGMGVSASANEIAGGEPGSGQASADSAEARLLEAQLSGIEKLNADPEEQSRVVLAIFPDDELRNMLSNLPKLQDQVARLKANPQMTYTELNQSARFAHATGKSPRQLHPEINSTNLLADAQSELDLQMQWIQERVNSILGTQRTRLKALQVASGSGESDSYQSRLKAMIATTGEDREIQSIQQMIQNSPDLINASGDTSGTPLVKAAYFGWLKVAAYLLDHGADINHPASDVRQTRELLEAGQVTPLVAAVLAGNKAMAKFLIDRGANVNFKVQNLDTPLHLAARKGFMAVVEVLLASHADVNAQNNVNKTPLFTAVENGWAKIIQMLLAAGANVNLKDNDGRTVLNHAINNSPEIVQALLDAKTNPNTEDKSGRTPLSYAVEKDNSEVVKLLLTAKADPNLGTLDTPLLCAIHNNDVLSAELLLLAGANPNATGRTTWNITINGTTYMGGPTPPVSPLYLAVSMNQLPMVQLLLKYKADPNDSQTDSQSLLFSVLDKPEIVKALLDAGADAGATNSIERNRVRFGGGPIYHETLLQNAAEQNLVETVELLLQHGANPDVCNERGNSALHYATFNLSDEKVFASLLGHKANPNVRNHDGKTPLDLVKQGLQNDNWVGRFESLDAKKADANKLIALLHQHGALDHLPDLDSITISRPSANLSFPILRKGTNNWNRFSLLEAIFNFYASSENYPVQGNGMTQLVLLKNLLPFPDLTRIVIARPNHNSTNDSHQVINLLNQTNGIDITKDIPLEFGDVVEIPERDHALGESATGLTDGQYSALTDYVKGTVQLVAHGQKVEIPIHRCGDRATLKTVLSTPAAQILLLVSSDLSRVKVTRAHPRAGEKREWLVNFNQSRSRYGGQLAPLAFSTDIETAPPDALWLRDGDVIEVPEKL